jgi:hypothetical protein
MTAGVMAKHMNQVLVLITQWKDQLVLMVVGATSSHCS